ncbi:hypothetical protein SAMN05421505_1694 [Sinosporangium album]|uniref:Uncharacterized protein n=1 Tax=Sinosporangium album TaxID=504805 RepID=A0A1G8LJ09_9ACTN|nr:hypothetical protein [Sinosporangium album]SDI55661.1 hypothetical protein SAMN05421505_1694 [Sinosporangium album]
MNELKHEDDAPPVGTPSIDAAPTTHISIRLLHRFETTDLSNSIGN